MGGYRFKVTIEKPVHKEIGAGEISPTYQSVRDDWVALKSDKAAEIQRHSQQFLEATYTVRALFSTDYTNGVRLRYHDHALNKDRFFHVVGLINVEEKNREWLMTCTESSGDNGGK